MRAFWERIRRTKTFIVGLVFMAVGGYAMSEGYTEAGAASVAYGGKLIAGRDTKAKEMEQQDAANNLQQEILDELKKDKK